MWQRVFFSARCEAIQHYQRSVRFTKSAWHPDDLLSPGIFHPDDLYCYVQIPAFPVIHVIECFLCRHMHSSCTYAFCRQQGATQMQQHSWIKTSKPNMTVFCQQKHCLLINLNKENELVCLTINPDITQSEP